MGRFQYKDDDDKDDDAQDEHDHDVAAARSRPTHHRDWNFVALPGEDEALVARQSAHADYPLEEDQELSHHMHEPTTYPPNPRTVFVVYHQHPPPSQQQGTNGSELLYDPYNNNHFDRQGDNHSDRRACCPLWLKITILAVLCNLIWYGWQEGPPAPPLSFSVGDDVEDGSNSSAELVTWEEYLQNHASDFITSGTALFVNLPYHVISWWSLHVHSDLYGIYEQWNKPRPCVLEWNGGNQQQQDNKIDERLSLCFAAQSQKLAVQKLVEGLQAWSWDLRLRPRPLVLLSSSMTPGLDPDGLGECLIRQLLYPSCAISPPPIQRLEMR
eukprot:scaffold2954_cov171-Amphora_coffeaeformis.AAC.1